MTGNVTTAIDLTGVTSGTYAYNDGHVTISSAGVIAVNGKAGVSCSGAPTASFAVTNGIVTHC